MSIKINLNLFLNHQVTNVGEKEDGNDKAVQHVHKILRRIFKNNGNQPISFFEFVLNPTEFHLTVENIFHLSFLLKNNHFAIKQSELSSFLMLPQFIQLVKTSVLYVNGFLWQPS